MHFILLSLAFSVYLGRYDRLETTIRHTLLSEVHVCGMKRIAYVYSKSDEMTWWEDVEGHAEMARGRGWDVVLWEVEGTRHVGYWKRREEEYGGRMRGLWDESDL